MEESQHEICRMPENRKAHIRMVAILGTLIALPYVPALVGAVRYAGADSLNQFIPWIRFLVREIQSGRFPLWDPHSFCGTPFFANSQVAFFYPFTWLALVVSMERFLILYHLAHGIGAGVVMYFWLHRKLKVHQAAFVGGLVWAWCGVAAGYRHAGFMAWAGAMPYLPLGFLFVDLWHERRRLVYGLLLVATLALQLHTGHPQPCLFSFYFLFGYSCWLALTAGGGGATLRQRMGLLVFVPLCFAGALLLAAVMLAPLVEVSSFTAARQGGASYQFATTDSLPPLHCITFLAPFFFGHPIDQSFWGTATGYHEICGYVGILPLVLALVAISKKTLRRFLVAAAVVSVVFAMGSFTPAFRILYHFIPGFLWFRVPGRLLLVYCFSMAGLAALGTADIIERPKERFGYTTKVLWGVLLAVLLTLTLALSFGRSRLEQRFIQQQKERDLQYSQQGGDMLKLSPEWESEVANACATRVQTMRSSVHQAVLWTVLSLGAIGLYVRGRRGLAIAIAALLLAVDLGLFNYGLIPYQDSEHYDATAFAESDTIRLLTSDKDFFRVLAMDNTIGFLMRERHPELYPERLSVHGIQSARGYNPIVLGHYAAHVNRIQGFPSDQPVGGLLFVPLEERLNRQALNQMNVRYLLSYRGAPDGFERVLHDRGLSVYRNLQDHPRAYIIRNGQTSSEDVEIQQYTPNRVRLRTVLSEPGTLVLADTWYPGWKTFVNGNKVTPELFDDVFRAVRLESGEQEVEFVFRPSTFFYGSLVSSAALIVWMLGSICFRKTSY